MTRIHLLLALNALLCAAPCFAQTTFRLELETGCYGAPSGEQTQDGGYIIAGEYLVKTDALGDTVWCRKYYLGASHDAGQTMDGGYIIGGGHSSGNTDFALTKTDSNGYVAWSRAYGGFSADESTAMVEMADSGFVIAGNSYSFGFGSYDTYVVRTDKQGDTLWTRAMGGFSDDKVACVDGALDGGVVLGGYTMSFGPFGGPTAFLTKLDALGNISWTKQYMKPTGGFVKGIAPTVDGGYVFTGISVGNGTFLVKTDGFGNIAWSKFYAYPQFSGNGVMVTQGGGYIIVGSAIVNSGNGYDISVIKTDSLGDTLWTRWFPETQHQEATDVAQTDDGGYLVTGRKTSGIAVYLIKMDSLGNTGCAQNFLPMEVNDSTFTPKDETFGEAAGGVVTSFIAAPMNYLIKPSICRVMANDVPDVQADFQVFPNPASERLVIGWQHTLDGRVLQVVDLLGNVVWEETIPPTHQYTLDVRPFPSGIYILRIAATEGEWVRKIVVQHN